MIVEYSDKYAEELKQLTMSFISESHEKMPQNYSEQRIFATVLSEKVKKILFVKDGKLAGVLLYYITSPWYSDEKTAQEFLLFVSKEFRGGFASHKLIKEYLKQAKEQSCVRAYIDYGVKNMSPESMRRLYEFHGFDISCYSYVKEL